MATLFNTQISDTYQGLLKTIDNNIISASLKELTDGAGNQTGLFINNLGDFKVANIFEFVNLKESTSGVTINKFVTSSDGLGNFNNDTSIPTSAAVKNYVDTVVTSQDLDFGGNSGSGSVDLDSELFMLIGTNGISTSAAGSNALAISGSALEAGISNNAINIATNTSGIATNVTNIANNTSNIAINTAGIATNVTDISTNASDISTNATNIATNVTNIAINTSDINTNSTNISNIDTDVTALESRVTVNESNIATNTTNIATNVLGISDNVTDIGTNAANISVNTSSIATNVTNIATNTSNISTNTSNIATNVINIASNSTDISTNEANITTNTSDIATETANRIAADNTLQSNIDTEATTRQTNDNTLQANIDAEASTRQSADTTLQGNIDTEATTRAAADTTLQNNINTEESSRISADATLQTNINSEETARIAADTNLQGQITTNDTDISNLQSNKQSISEKGQASGYVPLDANAKILETYLPASVLGGLIYQGTWNANTNTPTLPTPSTVKGHYYVVDTAGTYLGISYNIGDWVISNGTSWEKVDNTESVSSVFGRLGNVVANQSDYSSFYPLISDLNNEISARISGDTTLQNNINAEASTRATNDTTLQTNIDNEETARINADNVLQTNISNEASTRAAADTNLQSNIDAEESARISADTTLQSNIDTEEASRISADNTLQANINAITLTSLGFTGDTNANYITNNNQLINGAGYVTSSGNTIIGTDADINTSGAEVIDTINMTDGVIQSHSLRTLTLANLGYTGATNANYITNNNQLINGAGYITTSSVGNGQIDGRTSGLGLSGSMDATANQSGNTTFTVTSNASTSATASTIAYRTTSADIKARLFRSNYQNQSTISGGMAFRVNNGADDFIRFCSDKAAIRTFLGVPASGDLNSYLLNTTDTFTGTLTVSGDTDILDNDILIDSSHGFINSGPWTRNQTPSGYIDFGPANTSHAHIYTDRPNFYFNKALTVNGSSIINQNDIRSKIFYDVDNTSYYADFGSGQIILGGTGRIQGIDNVLAGTDATNRNYVDNAIAGSLNNYLLNTTDTFTGTLTVSGNLLLSDQVRIGDDAWIEDFNMANSIRIKGNQNSNQGYIAFGTQTKKLGCNNSSTLQYDGQTVWTAGNDGAGSGLDADLLDGQQGSYYAQASLLNNYLPLTGGTLTGELNVGDNVKIGKAGSQNYITFHGTTGDVSNYGTTYIGERIYGGTEQSELILYKGNDGQVSAASPDRIRLIGANLCFDVYDIAQTYPTDLNGVGVLPTTRAMTILGNGNVGIGTTSPGYKLDVSGNARFTETTRHNGGLYTSSTQTRNKISVWSSLSSYTIGMKSGFGYGGLGGDSTGTDYAMSFQMSNTTNRGWWWGDTAHTDLQGAMSLTTQGKLVVATSIKVGAGESTRSAGTSKLTVVAPLSSGGIGTDFQINGGSGFGMKTVQVEIPGYGDGIRVNSLAASSVDNNAITFYQDATKRGSIVINTTSTSYNTTSDYRLKENKEDISDAIERVKLLKPVKFNWISQPNQPKVDGFYAHELAEVVPEAVTGEKDALDYENKPDYQSIDQSKIVPLLSAALQQAIDKIEELETRIQLIENK